jgi:hypothetical protein
MKAKKIIRSMLVAELLLLVPLVAMIFSDKVDWSLYDFIIIGILLAGLGGAYQLIINGIKSNLLQAAIGIVLVAALVLIWIEMAVGLFGSPIAGS